MIVDDTKKIGIIIKEARKSQKLTQAELALAANVGTRFLVDIENGKTTAQIGKVIDVCLALGLKIDIQYSFKISSEVNFE